MQYVIDASQLTQVSVACVELYHTLGDESMRSVPLLIFINKTDLAAAMTRADIDLLFRLPELLRTATQPIAVLEGSAATGTGIDEVLHWMCKHHAELT